MQGYFGHCAIFKKATLCVRAHGLETTASTKLEEEKKARAPRGPFQEHQNAWALFKIAAMETLLMGAVLPTNFQRKLIKEGQFVAKRCCDVIALSKLCHIIKSIYIGVSVCVNLDLFVKQHTYYNIKINNYFKYIELLNTHFWMITKIFMASKTTHSEQLCFKQCISS